MWLLDTETLKLHHFITNIPDYVILSHTWSNGEVGFDDTAQPYARDMAGYSKILRCCAQASKTGFDWAWIDTCCIDKRSSAELSEAINSMYRWYWRAAICYVFMSDHSVGHRDFQSSRWFRRGWTLQELLAPDIVEFYDSDWIFLGTKTSLINRIVAATKIDKRCLLHRTAIEKASIAAKFSWASARMTTRVEDMAYCLLGLVQVNMPMLYGEGPGAFYRLQLEIIKQTNDHTIFAWDFTYHRSSLTSIFAHSPAQFANAADFRPDTTREKQPATYEMTNHGLNITMPCINGQTGFVALLNCSNSSGMRFGVQLASTGVSTYRRLDKSLVKVSHKEAKQAIPKTMYIETGSRSLQSTGGKSSSMRVYNMSDPGRIRYIATGTRLEVLPYRQTDSSTLDDHIVCDDAFISCVFVVNGLLHVLFFLGLHKGRPWMHASSLDRGKWIEEIETMRKFFKAGTEDKLISVQQSHFTDYLSLPLEGGRMLEAIARKTRSDVGQQWRVNIAIVLPQERGAPKTVRDNNTS